MMWRSCAVLPLFLTVGLLLGGCGDDSVDTGNGDSKPAEEIECFNDSMCATNAAGPVCDVQALKCVAGCLNDTQCPDEAAPKCDTAKKSCVAAPVVVMPVKCTSNDSCKGDPAGPVCDTGSGNCGPGCVEDAQCDQLIGEMCDTAIFKCVVPEPVKCTSNDSCKDDPAGSVCDLATGACGPGCSENAQCVGDAAGPVCDTNTGLCGPGCVGQSDCTDAAAPYCDLSKNECTTWPAGSLIGIGEESEKSVTISVAYTPAVPVETTDLGFHATRDELWVQHRRYEVQGVCAQANPSSARCRSLGGYTSTITAPGKDNQSVKVLEDGNSWHFMRRPPALAMGDNDLWATCGEAFTGNFEDNPAMFIGPTLWSSDPAIYAQPSGGNGSHMDMLHATPWCMGIAHQEANAYWVFNGNVGSIDFYNFHADHGPGNDDHSDGEIFRYVEGSLKRVPNVPSHMEYKDDDKHLYVVDTGNARVVKLDTESGTMGGRFSPVYEPLAASGTMEGATLTDLVTTGLTQPSGLALTEDAIYVSDHATGTLHAFDYQGTPLRTLDTGLGAGVLAGIEAGPDGRLWFVNMKTGAVHVITRN